MRLARIGDPGAERPVLVEPDGTLIDLGDAVVDFNPAFFSADILSTLDPRVGTRVAADGRRFGAPIARPGKIVCVGLNYRDHAEESGMPVPAEPILFMKDPATVVGPHDDVHYPRGGTKVDWEVELGVVIGRRARYLESDEDALACVAGYTVSNDLSERAFQLERGGQWDKGKSCETFNPLGPWLVTPDEVADPQQLGMWLDVNGEPAQRGNTKTMIFTVAELIRYISGFMVLEPGDLINTGTPPGVGMGRTPPAYLAVGDQLTLGIDGLGEQALRIVSAP
nr:fumarylacetoacetate hydrolase family protein [Kibdelosporangium sp. MJ126-NF4]CEL14111.1 2-hydroxyhepta-2,4-diene-1,7-dioate isomerase / 5-carboxymethyl-2-oxo-hex-3-ene-1,7-dioate decarboxylase [Kibdelosporangium sp. MJ126-NF4]CTQ88478.1 2-hydroxyhepta-2,4-diene-1,7-dioate isomerase (EC 5.3.3.-) / 5-carboxymethyl-2-oxo-hex-3-ene-1,7-dioate decarboxylase (EC 4.1.1.68) [Kibdelosporangium sp. MJ126-NF4]